MKFLRNLPISIQQLIIAGMVILTIITISIVTYSRISDIIVKKNIQYTKESIFQLKQNISTNYKEICALITNVGYDSTVQDFMLETEQYNKLALNDKISSILDVVKNVKSDLIDIEIIGKNNSKISLRGGNPYVIQFSEMVKPDGRIYCSEFRQIDYDITQDCFLFGMHVFSINKDKLSGEKIGFISAVVNVAAINDQVDRLPKLSGTRLYLVDKNGKVFFDNKLVNLPDNEILKNIDVNKYEPVIKDIDGKKSIVQVFQLPEITGKIVTIVPVKELFAELSDIKRNSLIVFMIAFIFISVPLFINIRNIVSPLKKLMNFMKDIRSGNLKNLKKRVFLEGNMEISTVANEFNNMLDEIDGLTHRLLDSNTRLYEIELEKKQAELAFLQSQINPHFLYNTLESIRGMASAKGVDEIKEMTRALSQIFRYSVKGTEDVNLSEEIEIIKSYVKIQQIRFQNRFDVEYHLNPEALECMVPKMILQPVVENAIYHGLEPTSRKGSLHIECSLKSVNELVVTVKDNGVGIDDDKLDKIMLDLSASDRKELAGGGANIGIVNVNNRLKLIYGDRYGIEIKSRINEGTEITLNIPARRQTNV
jgi:two-component system, sensor histidine kinase YesM